MNKTISRTLGWMLIGFGAAFASLAHADAVVHSLRGDARIGNTPITLDQRIYSGATISTGPGTLVVLRFDDGQQVVLNEATTFRITDFRYREAEPRGDRAVFDLLQGALRFVSGIVGARNRKIVQLRVPQATIGIRGTDFMVALVNPVYVSVISGAVRATNGAGSVVLGAGTVGTAASATSLAVTILATALPGAASSAFNGLAAAQLSAAAGVGAGGAAASASGAAPAAPASMRLGTAVGVRIAAGVIGTTLKSGGTTTNH